MSAPPQSVCCRIRRRAGERVAIVPHYRPSDAQESPRFGGIHTFARLPHVTDLDGVDVAIVGIPFDTATTYRVGARFGPAAVRDGSLLLRPYHPSVDVMVFEELSCVDYGDTSVVPGYIEDSYARITAGIAPILAAGVIPIGIGGDHSITLAELRAVAATARSRSSSSIRTAIRGTNTSGASTTMARPSAAPSKKG